jgi:hypothetical protein
MSIPSGRFVRVSALKPRLVRIAGAEYGDTLAPNSHAHARTQFVERHNVKRFARTSERAFRIAPTQPAERSCCTVGLRGRATETTSQPNTDTES